MQLHEIGSEIKRLRKEKNLTQEQVAVMSGISRVTLGKIEKGVLGSVSVKTLDIILSILEYEIEFKRKNNFGLIDLDELSS